MIRTRNRFRHARSRFRLARRVWQEGLPEVTVRHSASPFTNVQDGLEALHTVTVSYEGTTRGVGPGLDGFWAVNGRFTVEQKYAVDAETGRQIVTTERVWTHGLCSHPPRLPAVNPDAQCADDLNYWLYPEEDGSISVMTVCQECGYVATTPIDDVLARPCVIRT